MHYRLEKRALQACVALACFVPVSAGLGGIFLGTRFVGGDGANPSLESHFRYLCGLLLGIGIAFITTIPAIERKTSRFRLLTFLVLVGGIARLYSVFASGMPDFPMQFGLVMELAITPGLCLWQGHLARRTFRISKNH